MKSKPYPTLTIALLACFTVSAKAAITYVDATDGSGGNTRATDGSQSDTSWYVADTTSTNSTKWSKRTSVEGFDDTIFQALPNGISSIPELTTTISGLAAGTYGIWVFYWDQVSSDAQNWTIAAGLTSGSLTTYSSPGEPVVAGATTVNVTNAADLTITGFGAGDVESTDSNRQLFGVYLGNATVSGGGDINVYVDMLINGSSSASRTWYDGVGYELIPEPSAALMLGMASLGLLRRHRNR